VASILPAPPILFASRAPLLREDFFHPSTSRLSSAAPLRRRMTDLAYLSSLLFRTTCGKRGFAGDRGVIGRTTQVNGRNASVIGVMPQTFAFPPGESDPPDIWLPMQLPPPRLEQRGRHYLFLIGRLRQAVSLGRAQEEIARHVGQSADRLGAKNHPFSRENHPMIAYALQDEVVRTIRPALWTLMGAVGFVLLIACVNVANLLLARAEARQREIAIRKALGASTGQLVRQFTIEGLLLSLGGAALGLFLAVGGLKIMVAAGRASLPRASEVNVDPMVLAVTIAISLITALFFGLAPLAQIARFVESLPLRAGIERTRARAGSSHWHGTYDPRILEAQRS
jgi:putative ABC transport system permease protein